MNLSFIEYLRGFNSLFTKASENMYNDYAKNRKDITKQRAAVICLSNDIIRNLTSNISAEC